MFKDRSRLRRAPTTEVTRGIPGPIVRQPSVGDDAIAGVHDRRVARPLGADAAILDLHKATGVATHLPTASHVAGRRVSRAPLKLIWRFPCGRHSIRRTLRRT